MREPLFADELTVRPSHRRQGVMFVGIERDIFHVLRLLSAADAVECCPTPTVISPWAEAQRFHPIKGRCFKSSPGLERRSAVRHGLE
jgi:hypothetical protein